MATAVRRPMPSTLAIRSSRVERSRCSRMAATSCLSSACRSLLNLSISCFQNSRIRWSQHASRRVLTWATSCVSCSIIVKRWASGAKRASGGSWMSVAAAEDRIDVVVLGMLQHELGVGAHLHRLEDNDSKAVRPQERNHRLLITPTCFDPNALDLALAQPGRQAPIARGAIVDLQLIRAFVDRHVQLVLAGIDPGAHGAILAHLLRPFLVMRTLGSFNHPGPMKSRSRSCSAAALVARERAIRRPATCSGCAPGAGHSSRNARTIPIRANTRSAHASACARLEGEVGPDPTHGAPSCFETRRSACAATLLSMRAKTRLI